MGHNVVQDAANTLPHMIMSERIGYADLEAMAQLPDGIFSIDLLSRQTDHASGMPVALQIVEQLSDWLEQRLAKKGLGMRDLVEARLALALRTDLIRTDRARVIPFSWRCTCTLVTRAGKTVNGEASGLTWYDRDRSSA